jgi:hypothetical protein
VPEEVTCSRCQTANAPESRFCERCGTALGPGAPTTAPGDRVERNMALREFGKARQVVSTLRILYVLGAILLAIYVFIWIGIGTAERLGTSVIYLTILAILIGMLALQIVGAIRVSREPFLWSVVIAGFATLGFAIYLVSGPIDIVGLAIRGFWVLVLWGGVATAARLRNIMRAHPDLADSLAAGRRRGVQHVPGDAQKRFKARARAQRRNLLVLCASLAVVIPLAIWAFLELSGPPDLEDRVADFGRAWNSASLDGLEPYFTPAASENDRAGLERKMKQRGWTRLPQLGDPRVEDGGGSRGQAIFPLPKGELRTRWKLEDRHWVLTGITFPEVEADPADDTIQRFAEAWNEGSLQDLVGFFAEESHDKQLRTLNRIFGRREWVETRPELTESDVRMRGPGRARVYHVVGQNELRSDWEWQAPKWILVGLKLPPR